MNTVFGPGREIGVPAHTAADASGVKGESKVYVELPDGTREDITGKDTYTPKVAGTHYWVFTASDMLDNISEKKLKFEVVGAPFPNRMSSPILNRNSAPIR